MKKLKVMMMTLMMCLVSMSAWGQDERTNRPNLLFEQESDKLTEAIGWYYHESNGEWIDYKNVILDSKIYKEYITLLEKVNKSEEIKVLVTDIRNIQKITFSTSFGSILKWCNTKNILIAA